MKLSAGTIGFHIAAFIWSIFMGVTAVSIGLGAAYPPANLVAKPFVCPNGTMRYEQATSNPLPGTTYTLTAWYCVDNRSGAKTELGIFPMSLYSGVIYGLLIYGLGLIVWLFRRRGKGTEQTHLGRKTAATGDFNHDRRPTHPAPAPARADAQARMQQLKDLHAANMISESEYQQKRADILKDL